MPKKRTAHEMEEAASSRSSIERISRNGNIILEVGERRMLVSSTVLSETSTAFAALLGPRIREGQDVQN